jgi:MFS family permease
LFSLFAAFCVLAIRPSDIDHERARGADDGPSKGIAIAALLRHGSLLLLATCLALFHLANAAMLPLVGQRLALAHAGYESAMMSACIVAAQLVMLPVALLCGAWADRLGRRPILLVAFAVLPLRGLLYTLSDAPAWLIGVQLLDGIGAGVLGVMVPLVVADLTRGTGRYNLSLGGVAMVCGVGAALSNAVAGAPSSCPKATTPPSWRSPSSLSQPCCCCGACCPKRRQSRPVPLATRYRGGFDLADHPVADRIEPLHDRGLVRALALPR